MPWPQLKAMPREALTLVKPIGDLRIDYLPRTGLALLRLFLVLRLLRRSSLLGDLIVGAPTRTIDANRALEALATSARENSQLRETISNLDPKALSAFPDFEAEFNSWRGSALACCQARMAESEESRRQLTSPSCGTRMLK